jgi:hypothetical protein
MATNPKKSSVEPSSSTAVGESVCIWKCRGSQGRPHRGCCSNYRIRYWSRIRCSSTALSFCWATIGSCWSCVVVDNNYYWALIWVICITYILIRRNIKLLNIMRARHQRTHLMGLSNRDTNLF